MDEAAKKWRGYNSRTIGRAAEDMRIGNREISREEKPYIIAEISANHNGSLNSAAKLLHSAKRGRADAVKLQTYTADTLTIDSQEPDFYLTEGLWSGRTLYELYQSAHTPWEWHSDLFSLAEEIGIPIFSSPFDRSAVDLLVSLNVPAFKIASFEIVDLDLIHYAARQGRPLIISTGLANRKEISEALEATDAAGLARSNIALLHCLSAYPAPPSEYKLESIPKLREDFGVEVGLSDHTIGNEVATAAIALGATIIEKHFTLDTNGGGPDDSFSMDFEGLSRLRSASDTVWQSLGFDDYRIQPSEEPSLKYRRSLYAVQNIEIGDVLSDDNVRSIRPGFGVAPKYLPLLRGRTSPISIRKGNRIPPLLLEELGI